MKRAALRHVCRVIVTVGLLSVGLAGSGCAVLLVGAGAVGGYALSKDSVKNHYERSASMAFDQALSIVEDLGLVELRDKEKGLIKGTVEGAEVTVTIKPLTKHTIELKVKARDSLNVLPKIEIAQRVYNRIDDRLK